ncbi:retrotransposable element tf2 protein type 2 [Lasius niger]|uniref:Retrotransposable element tf2 protein type 2 n=1 Tax=Lasius niger TaxID=67767 RepID=A0A0J7K580_LASNI|nr:retrotransposable element tf2 protein type 2 [Lasius niger]
MLAIVKTIKRFHIYVYGLEFTVVTNCNAVVHAITKACLNRRIARWILRLQNYTFKVKHTDGRHMAHVDALSRIVCFTDSILLEEELQYRQFQDPKIKMIAESLELNDHEDFELTDGLVFKKGIHKHRFVVPD